MSLVEFLHHLTGLMISAKLLRLHLLHLDLYLGGDICCWPEFSDARDSKCPIQHLPNEDIHNEPNVLGILLLAFLISLTLEILNENEEFGLQVVEAL